MSKQIIIQNGKVIFPDKIEDNLSIVCENGKIVDISKTEDVVPVEGDEVIDALKSLGFKKDEIMSTLKEMPESFRTTQEKVKFVLKNARKRS